MSEEKKRRGTRVLTEGEKGSIVILRHEGVPVKAIAEKLGRSERCVWTYLGNMRKNAKAEGLDTVDWRENMRQKAIVAVGAGLDCEDDPYKRGNLGTRALQGLGDFAAENQVNANLLIATMPPEFRDRYLISADEEPPGRV